MAAVDVTVHYLEMHANPGREVLAPREGLLVLHARRPSVAYYRFLYAAVGREYHWYSRGRLTDARLAEIIQDARNEVHVLHVDGNPAGFAELNRGVPDEVELVQFGLMRDYIGQGLGKYFLQWTIDRAWSYGPRRLWLHTCTLDHPKALPNYLAAGFTSYDEQKIVREIV